MSIVLLAGGNLTIFEKINTTFPFIALIAIISIIIAGAIMYKDLFSPAPVQTSAPTIAPTVAPPIPCPEGHYCASTTTCNSGFYCDGDINSIQQDCPAGSYCPTGSGAPIQCPAGSYCPAISSSPTQCPDNSYCPAGSGVPTQCPAGSYCTAGTQTPCPAGSFCPASSTSPTQCPAGSYCPGSTDSAIICPAGSYCPVGSSSPLSCNNLGPCPEGSVSLPATYQCQEGKYCLATNACPAGTFCPQDMSNPPSQQLTCPAGFYCPAGSGSGTICPAGSYCPTGASTPTICFLGTYCPSGSTAPIVPNPVTQISQNWNSGVKYSYNYICPVSEGSYVSVDYLGKYISSAGFQTTTCYSSSMGNIIVSGIGILNLLDSSKTAFTKVNMVPLPYMTLSGDGSVYALIDGNNNLTVYPVVVGKSSSSQLLKLPSPFFTGFTLTRNLCISVSYDGTTVSISGSNGFTGAAYAFKAGVSMSGLPNSTSSLINCSSLSADGGTVAYGISASNMIWIYGYDGNEWVSETDSLGNTNIAIDSAVGLGKCISVSQNGSIVATCDNSSTWIFMKDTMWYLVYNLTTGVSSSLSLSYDGTMLAVGLSGAASIWYRSNSDWIQGQQFTGTGGFGTSVALSGDSSTLVVGAPNDGTYGAIWIYANTTVISTSAPTSTPVSTSTPTQPPTNPPTQAPITQAPTSAPAPTPAPPLTCNPGYFFKRAGSGISNPDNPAQTIWGPACVHCPAGYYCVGGTTYLQQCPTGSYCSIGSSSPAQCPAGYYCPGSIGGFNPGTKTPLVCPAGYYCTAGSSAPTPCGPDPSNETSICPQGTTQQPQCSIM